VILLLEAPHPLGVITAQPRLDAVVDLGSVNSGAQPLGPDPELLSNPRHRAVIGAQLLSKLTQRAQPGPSQLLSIDASLASQATFDVA
jgi:hypothetical protein